MHPDKKMRVMVFEDDLATADLFRKMLQGFGYEVRTFPDPTACPVYRNPECSCTMAEPCTDALITDMMMPNMSGLELLRLQRRRGCRAPDANKALMSAAISAQQQAAVAELGCHFFRKPFKIAEVRQWLEECAQRIEAPAQQGSRPGLQ